VAEDQGKEEEKFDFTDEGEGYFNLDDAILSARRLVRQDEQRYLSRTGWDEIVWSTSESVAGDASLKVILQFRRPARELPEDERGLEEFLFGYDGELQDRQILFWPNNSSTSTTVELALPPVPAPAPTPSLTTVPAPGAVFVSKWGTEGTGDGQFNEPAGVAVAADGSVYVADFANHRVQKFTSEGVFVTSWGTEGTGDGQFDHPSSVAVTLDGNVYIADFWNHRIQKFTSEGVFVTKWGAEGDGAGQFQDPGAVSVAPDGIVYVADRGNDRIQEFTADGMFLQEWGEWGRFNNGSFYFYEPTDVTVASDGSVYVVHSTPSRIDKFTSGGELVETFDSNAEGYGAAVTTGTALESDYLGDVLGDVAVALDGNIYVVEYGTNCIQKFSSEGKFITEWGTEGTSDGEFISPSGIAVAPDGSVYVTDQGNHRIQKFALRP